MNDDRYNWSRYLNRISDLINNIFTKNRKYLVSFSSMQIIDKHNIRQLITMTTDQKVTQNQQNNYKKQQQQKHTTCELTLFMRPNIKPSINNYLILEQIGKGSYGIVYKARERYGEERKVAIKITTLKLTKIVKTAIPIYCPSYPSYAIHRQTEALSRKEIEILGRIDHPNIIKLYQSFQKSDIWHMVFEYCGNGDLEILLQKQKVLKQDIARLITLKIVDAVGYLHAQNIAHRDIKLPNILINQKFEIKLADLGFAKELIGDMDLLKSTAGTPVNMAPEIFEGKGYTMKCDVWSIGTVVYQMLYGRLPFLPDQKGNLQSLKISIRKKQVYLDPNVPVSAQGKDFIQECLKKDSSQRKSAAELMQHPWLKQAQNLQTSLAQSISDLYKKSKIYFVEQQSDILVELPELDKELKNNIQKTFDLFNKNYQGIVDEINYNFSALDEYFKEKGLDHLRPILYDALQEKFKEFEKPNIIITILLPDPSESTTSTHSEYEVIENSKVPVKKQRTLILQHNSYARSKKAAQYFNKQLVRRKQEVADVKVEHYKKFLCPLRKLFFEVVANYNSLLKQGASHQQLTRGMEQLISFQKFARYKLDGPRISFSVQETLQEGLRNEVPRVLARISDEELIKMINVKSYMQEPTLIEALVGEIVWQEPKKIKETLNSLNEFISQFTIFQ